MPRQFFDSFSQFEVFLTRHSATTFRNLAEGQDVCSMVNYGVLCLLAESLWMLLQRRVKLKAPRLCSFDLSLFQVNTHVPETRPMGHSLLLRLELLNHTPVGQGFHALVEALWRNANTRPIVTMNVELFTTLFGIIELRANATTKCVVPSSVER